MAPHKLLPIIDDAHTSIIAHTHLSQEYFVSPIGLDIQLFNLSSPARSPCHLLPSYPNHFLASLSFAKGHLIKLTYRITVTSRILSSQPS